MFKIVFMALILIQASISPAWAGRPTEAQDSKSGRFTMGDEQIGALRIGLMEKELAGKISCALNKSKEILEAATGEYIQTWKYPGCGIEIKMGSENKGGTKMIESITVTSPCAMTTRAGIRIGSTEGEVLKAYGKYRDQDDATKKGKRFVAGSIFDGMIFQFKKGKVVEIFLGAAAE